MDKRSNKRRGPITLLITSRRLRRLTAFVIAVPVLYILSLGPVCRTVNDVNLLSTIYSPLVRMANASGWQWPGEMIRSCGGERAPLMALIVLITDTVRVDSAWDVNGAAAEQDEP